MGIWGLVFALWAMYLSAWDLRSHRLPNHATLPAALGVGAWRMMQDPGYIVAGLLWFGLYALVAVVLQGGVGGGDLKLAPTLGWLLAPLGLQAVLLAIVLASALTLLLGIASRCVGQGQAKGVAHGPGMLLASAIAWWIST
ncbi:prepilin peptidase [Corynebacterium pseudopelargi]|uniref:Type IV leader peptidase family protein n=1 Tax=Corynebacterium pseudopelargi TaxID=2080757 RepID=A0A3G6IUC9_9CORY|nr:prepilin peptidase [Corynebacterium pseudopelargi]AZA09177.1 Type IV leader peptidase family protein [Corynebacterium pseudopelargi]